MGKSRPNNVRRTNFTVDWIDSIDPPAVGKTRRQYSDAKTPSLKLRVTEKGSKSLGYAFRSPEAGHKVRVHLERWPTDPETPVDAKATILARARSKRAIAEGQVLNGECPARIRREERRQIRETRLAEKSDRRRALGLDVAIDDPKQATFGEVVDRYLEDPEIAALKTWPQIESRLRRFWVSPEDRRGIGGRVIGDVQPLDISYRRDALLAAGTPGAAREALKHLKAVMNWAIAHGFLDRSPGLNIRVKRVARDRRWFSSEEYGAAWLCAGRLPDPWRAAWRLLMLTGCRRSEIWNARWSEIDAAREWLTIPAERYKTDITHRVALSDLAREELDRLVPVAGEDPLLLTVDPSGRRSIMNVERQRDELLRMMQETIGKDVTHFSPHDLRRTVRSHLAMIGVRDEVAREVMGHTRLGMDGSYQRYSFDAEKRAAMKLLADHIRTLAVKFEN